MLRNFYQVIVRNLYNIIIIPLIFGLILGYIAFAMPVEYLAPNLILIRLKPLEKELSPQEMKMAKIAWKYFENNYQPNTGFVNSVDGYPSTTMWDTASYLAGLFSAHKLGIIDDFEFDKRMKKLLATLNNLDKFRGLLPNKAYNTKSGARVNYNNQLGEVGYSAIDIGRLLIWLKTIKHYYPQYADDIDNIVLGWNFCSAVDKCGNLTGMVLDENYQMQTLQEGRLGYEEYAAKGFALWNFNTRSAMQKAPYSYLPIYCVPIAYDARDVRIWHAHNYVVSETSILEGVELGWKRPLFDSKSKNWQWELDRWSYNFAMRVFEVQHRRFKDTGIVTARTEHHIESDPYFIYDTIFADGFPWNTITENGVYMPQVSAVASKAAIGLWSLWDHNYSDVLFKKTANLYEPDKGFYEGWYENASGPIPIFTANSNGIILEVLLYRKMGPLLLTGPFKPSKWDKMLSSDPQKFQYDSVRRCHPTSSCPNNEKESSCSRKSFSR